MFSEGQTPIKCIIVDDEPMARDVIRRYIEKIPILEVVAEFGNGINAMLFLQEQKIDLIFLDIHMPHLSGTDFVKALKDAPKIIFTTAFKEYALEGFELDAVDYLLKPIRFDRFLKSLNKAFPKSPIEKPVSRSYEKKDDNGFIYVKSERKMIKVMLDDILYIESARDYLKIFIADKFIVTRQTISSLEAMLSDCDFTRIHRSFIVSLKKITSFTNETVQVGKTELPIGKFYQNSFLKLQGQVKTTIR